MSECPECGGTQWATASDGLGEVASVAAVCRGCGYLTTSWISISSTPPDHACDERCDHLGEWLDGGAR